MLLLIDTCFWNHLHQLYEEKILDIRPILISFRIAITQEVLNEITHFKLETFVPFNDFFIIPITKHELEERFPSQYYLDTADQSLIIAYEKNEREEPVLLTDDGGLLCECTQINMSALYLPDFLLYLVRNDKLSKNIMAKCLRYWKSHGVYRKQDIKEWNVEFKT